MIFLLETSQSMPTQRFREATPATAEREGRAPAAHRGRRLGSGARRDLRWALQQHPGEHVREVCMHGVKITFFTQQAGRAKDSAIAHGQRDTPEPSSQSPEHDTPPLNSRRRRSRRRAQAYYANKATSRAGTTGAMQIVEDGDNARRTSGAAQATATPPGVFVFGAGSPPLGTAACTFDGAGTERASANAAPRVDAGTSGGDRSREASRSGRPRGRGRGRGGSK